MRAARPSITLAAAIAAFAPATAEAASLEPLKPCYRSVDAAAREAVHVQAGGFTPGAAVDVAVDGIVVRTAEALPDGTVVGEVMAPHQRRGQRPFTLTVTERDQPANTASAPSRIAALSLRLQPRRSRPNRRVRFIGLGFTDGPEVFAHYLRGGKLRRTVSLGAPEGACGRVDVQRPQIPVRRPATGRWTLQADNQSVFSPEPSSVFVRVAITVEKRLRR